MKKSLAILFERLVREMKERPDDSIRSFHFHYPLVDMMREINGDGSTTFHPKKVLDHGINPRSFRKLWAESFAQHTLKFHDNLFTSPEIVKRCDTLLKTDDEYSFGNMLPNDLKKLIEEKRAKNAAPMQTAPALQNIA